MKYQLTDVQRYDTPTLQKELDDAAITASINGHGDKSFTVMTDDEAGADIVVQAHIAKTDIQHDADIADMEQEQIVNFQNVDKFLKAYALCINDGSIVPGSNMTNAALKAAIKSKL